MNVVYCNPISLDYRLPYFVELQRRFDDHFYLVYSPMRYKLYGKEGLLGKIKDALGEKAIPLTGEGLLDVRNWKWNSWDAKGYRHVTLMFGIGQSVKNIKPDALITDGYFQWTPWVLLYGLAHRIPVYMAYERTLHTERHCGFLKRHIRRFINRFFAGFLANGVETQKYLESLGVSAEKIHICGMNADADFLRRSVEGFRQSPDYDGFKESVIGVPQGKGICYVFCGYLIERKGIIPLVSAWERHIQDYPHDHLILVGNGPLEEEAKSICGNDSSVYFAGRVPYDEVPKYYAIADVSIMPTIEDNWSLVVPEAMACGLPIATSVYNGCHPELIKEGVNGYTFDTHRQESIMKALAQFHRDDLNAMGQASQELEKEFSAEKCAARVYRALTEDLAPSFSKK